MEDKKIIEYPDPKTGRWMRGYMDDEGNMVQVSDDEKAQQSKGTVKNRPKSRKNGKRSEDRENSESKLTIRFSKEELRRFTKFCMWYSLVYERKSQTSMIKALIDANYRKYPAFREFENSIPDNS